MRELREQVFPATRRSLILEEVTQKQNDPDVLDKEDAVLLLAHLICDNAFSIFYQRIIKLEAGSPFFSDNNNNRQVFGYEALTRALDRKNFKSSEALFRCAEDSEMLVSLENHLWRAALAPAQEICRGDKKMFLNCSPKTLQDPHFNPFDLLKYIRQAGLSCDNVVLEITERVSMKDRWNEFRDALKIFRDARVQIAMDDTGGGGHNSFAMIAELEPDFLKIDGSLINGLSTSKLKRTIVEAFVRISEQANAVLIAEGIEKVDDVEVLVSLGVGYGQGNLLGIPMEPDRNHRC